MSVEYTKMLDIAKTIMSKNSEYYLCGSVALIHAKAIKQRNVNDIDFLVMAEDFNINNLNIDKNYPKA
jgi:hypothetical protein